MFNAVSNGRERTEPADDQALANPDELAAQLMVVASVAPMVANGETELTRLDRGALEVRLSTGAAFIFDRRGVERLT